MNSSRIESAPYLLVDGALAADAVASFDDSEWMTGWVYPIYTGDGALVGPLLIDIAAAVADARIDGMMALANAMSPQLHLSLIETRLSAADLVRHLQQFNAVRNGDGQLFNLRYSDCVAQSRLETVLSPAQWTAVTGPMHRWAIHTRDGDLHALHVSVPSGPPLPTPLTLSSAQFDELAELGAADVMLACIRDIRHGEPLAGTPSEQHRWAIGARQLWRAAGSSDQLVLRWITAAAVDTRGGVLSRSELPLLLASSDREHIRSELAAQVAALNNRASVNTATQSIEEVT